MIQKDLLDCFISEAISYRHEMGFSWGDLTVNARPDLDVLKWNIRYKTFHKYITSEIYPDESNYVYNSIIDHIRNIDDSTTHR